MEKSDSVANANYFIEWIQEKHEEKNKMLFLKAKRYLFLHWELWNSFTQRSSIVLDAEIGFTRDYLFSYFQIERSQYVQR